VRLGDLKTQHFEAAKNGGGRWLRTYGPGKYNLHAHVGVGDLTLWW
jgi:hypothetical protein